MSAIGAVLRREGVAHGIRTIAARAVRRVGASTNARILGWSEGRLPLGSTVIGAARISVEPGFDAAAPVWIEAVTEFAGRSHDPVIRIGARFSTSGRLHISAMDRIEIGSDCLFGTNVYVGDHAHGASTGPGQTAPSVAPRARPLHSRGPVVIGDRVWLGDNVVVVAGVTIGDGAIVGANAVVTRDIPASSIAVGAPARAVKRFDDTTGEYRALEHARG